MERSTSPFSMVRSVAILALICCSLSCPAAARVALDGGREQGIPPPPVAGNPVEVPSPGFLPPPPPPGSPVNTPCPSTPNHATPLRPAYGNPVAPSPSVPIPPPPILVGRNQLATPIPSVPSPPLPPVQVPVSTPCYSIPIHVPPVPEMSAPTPHRKTLQHVVKNIR
ncbi:pollen-specific leucine-rich repeat extensin-like protein 3 [Triticum aestivum]|uniref:pollen-specific leucine-rich repeat extensin-like protein 3 n=1 Tax=Triticum aestivum TaxID=4565 RepID=UPI001D033D8E|nr:pollen-specific leucine-rich repeat extensin-like protein 3 [Triticum aestivum]